MNRRKILFGAILAVFVIASVWWVFCFPYDPRLLYSAIPGNAVFISEHQKFARRWTDAAGNPLVVGILQASGIATQDVHELASDSCTIDIVSRFGSRNTVLAYVPSLEGTGEPAWVLSSWAGFHTQLARIGYYSFFLGDFDCVRVDGRKVWILKEEESVSGSEDRLSLAVFEGLLLGCYSRDPVGVRFLVERALRGASLVAELEERMAIPDGGECLDRVWVDGELGFAPGDFKAGLTALNGGRVTGWVRCKSPITNAVADANALGGLIPVVGDAPEAIIVASAASVEQLLSLPIVPDYLKPTAGALSKVADGKGLFFAALLGSDYSGRLVGFRVPAVVAGTRTGIEHPLKLVGETLDKINAQNRWAMIPQRVEEDGMTMVVLKSAKSGIFDQLRSGSAFTTNGEWLVFGSDAGSLRKLAAATRAGAAGSPRWLAGFPRKPALAGMWVSLPTTGRILRDIAAILSIASPDERELLDRTRIVLAAMAPLERAVATLSREGEELVLEFDIGN